MPERAEQALDVYRAGDVDRARARLRALIAADGSISAYRALAGLELGEGNSSDATAMLRVVAVSHDQVFGPQAAVALALLDDPAVAGPVLRGLVKELTGDLDGAHAIYVGTAAEGDAARSALANAFLGGLLVRTGREEEALEPLMAAAESGDQLSASYACYLVGPILLELEGVELAGSALWRAVEADHPAIRAWAALMLSEMCAASGELGRARASFELTAKLLDLSGHHGLLPPCYAGLFDVLVRQDDRDALRDRYELVAASGQVELVPGFVCWMLGEESILGHDLPAARAMLEQVAESDEVLGTAATAVRCMISGEYDAVRSALLRLRASDTDRHRCTSQLCFQVTLQLAAPDHWSALETLAELGDSDSMSRALFLLGKARLAIGDQEGAVDAWRKGAAIDHPVLARSSATGLGVLLTVRGDLDGARAAFGPGVAYPFARIVGEDLQESGDIDGALGAFTIVMAGDDPVEAGCAAYNIGCIRAEQGDLNAAAAAFRRAGASGNDEDAARACHQLALVCRGLGDPRGAADAVVAEHRHATATGSATLIADAACRLGDLRREQGDFVAAREMYEQVVQFGESSAVAWGVLGLGIVAMESGDFESARRRFQQVVDAPHYRTRTMAILALGHIAKERRDLPEARRWYQQVIDSGDLEDSSLATAHLGELCYWLGDRDEARTHYQRVLDISEQKDLVAEAAFRLGEMAAQDGDLARATKLLTIARDTDDPDFARQAAGMLTHPPDRQSM